MLERVGKYDIVEEIGRGGMATVYRARDARLKREVALKVMHPHLQGAPEARARFEREAQTVARLEHPGLLEIYDYSGEDSEVHFIATELLDGPTLKRFADEHPHVPAEIAACIVLQVARALSVAHGAGVVHRDVKPENLMLHHGQVKLTDFGIAQLVDVQGMTTTGQVLGSPGHMAPEQIEGKDCTPQSDLFALGTVLFLLAAGRLPFQGRNAHHVLKQIVDGDFPDPLRLRPDMGAPLARVIHRCLARSLADRYPSAEALIADLSEFVDASGVGEPDVALRAYLDDPDGFSRRLRLDLIDSLIARGEAAQRADQRAEALEHFERVLALDEGNPRVMEALANLGRRAKRRRLAQIAAAGVVVAAMVAVASFVLVTEAPAPRAVLLPATELTTPILREARVPARLPTDSPDAGATQAQGVPPEPSQAGAGTRERPPRSPRSPRRPRGIVSSTPRTVRFRPTPANVSIAIDGGELRAFGPSFREVELAPGKHRFRFVGALDCCDELEFSAVIPPGPGTTTLARRLTFRPAGLYVVTDRPANVEVDGGAVSGRSRSVIRVPHERTLSQRHAVRVTAEGHAPFEAKVSLRSGQVKTLQVPLRPLDPPQTGALR